MTSEVFLFVLLAILCMIFGAFIGNRLARLKFNAKTAALEERLHQEHLQIEKLDEQFKNALLDKESLREEKEFLGNELTKQNAAYDHLKQRSQEQQEEVEKLQEKFAKEFENLANKIFDENSKKLTHRNK